MKTQSPALSNDVDLFPGAPIRWGLGYMLNMQPGPNGRSAGTVSWGGHLQHLLLDRPVEARHRADHDADPALRRHARAEALRAVRAGRLRGVEDGVTDGGHPAPIGAGRPRVRRRVGTREATTMRAARVARCAPPPGPGRGRVPALRHLPPGHRGGVFTNSVFGFLRCYVLLAVAATTGRRRLRRGAAGHYCWASQGLIGVVMLWGGPSWPTGSAAATWSPTCSARSTPSPRTSRSTWAGPGSPG